MTRTFTFGQDGFYHIYNRGTEKRDIFNNKNDYERFLSLLYLCNRPSPADLKLQGPTLYEINALNKEEPITTIISYCLMPNHFHLILKETTEGGISKFMQKILTGYTMYFNKRYERTGALFQGRFKASHVDNDRYFKYLVSYVHLNPIKLMQPNWKEEGIKNIGAAKAFLNTYKYSSFLDYLNRGRKENILINKDKIMELSEKSGDFESNLYDWLQYKTDILQGPTL